jgi:hypothetical protein
MFGDAVGGGDGITKGVVNGVELGAEREGAFETLSLEEEWL